MTYNHVIKCPRLTRFETTKNSCFTSNQQSLHFAPCHHKGSQKVYSCCPGRFASLVPGRSRLRSLFGRVAKFDVYAIHLVEVPLSQSVNTLDSATEAMTEATDNSWIQHSVHHGSSFHILPHFHLPDLSDSIDV